MSPVLGSGSDGESSTLSVLLVEDNPGDIELIHSHLDPVSQPKYVLHSVRTLGEAMVRLDSEKVDLVLLDLSLPDATGLDSLISICSAAFDVPVIVLTGLVDESIAVEALQHGAQDFLLKDTIDADRLLRAMGQSVERHHLRAALNRAVVNARQSEAKFRTLIEDSPEAMMVLDTMGKVYHLNPAAESLFGKTSDELIGRYHDLPVGGQGSSEVKIEIEGQSPRTAEVFVARTEWEGKPAFLMSLRDVTDRKQAEERLRRSEEEVRKVLRSLDRGFSALAGGDLSIRIAGDEETRGVPGALFRVLVEFDDMVSQLQSMTEMTAQLRSMFAHDLRSPLSTILLTVAALEDYPEADEESRLAWLSTIRRNGERLVRLVDNLLELFVIHSGKMVLSYEDTDVNDLARRCVEDLRHQAAQKGQMLSFSPLEGRGEITADVTRLHQVLENLVGNAIKYCPEGASIEVSLHEQARDEVRIEVRDDGPGIPEEERAGVFTLFRRGKAELERTPGKGLGLAICMEFIRLHGGEMRLEEASADGGCLFVITIPRKPPRAPAEGALLGDGRKAVMGRGGDGESVAGRASETAVGLGRDGADAGACE